MVPRTWGGQLFCIFYALFGIPIFGAVLVGTGERLQIPIKKLHQSRPWVKDNPIRDQKLKSILLLSTGMSVIVFIPAWVFTITEDWSYLEGMYYSVITLTTVGFGDLVPGEESTKHNN
ncbi:potassium channel subfamily k member 16 [Plakobranchus ocellatus]|uniref:Potassium channel subfamily k member 16 n=1 Tax=Plakobranchus ocellatus TaxID=259542 RepID=A0AAV4B3A0_9GAST|nr:potassium channel subfamily k member 16 [Plakobranchus ocellatus]